MELGKVLEAVKHVAGITGSPENFRAALKFTLENEGLYSYDDGAETYRGISRRYYPEWEGWRYLDRGDREEADRYVASFYYQRFWLPLRCHRLPVPLAMALFDYAVNAGIRKAVTDLQKSLNELGADIAVDGIMGPVTVNAILSLDADRLRKLYLKLLARRVAHYIKLARNENYEKFIRGWLVRVFNLLVEVEGLHV